MDTTTASLAARLDDVRQLHDAIEKLEVELVALIESAAAGGADVPQIADALRLGEHCAASPGCPVEITRTTTTVITSVPVPADRPLARTSCSS